MDLHSESLSSCSQFSPFLKTICFERKEYIGIQMMFAASIKCNSRKDIEIQVKL